jgi:hypothetical protein
MKKLEKSLQISTKFLMLLVLVVIIIYYTQLSLYHQIIKEDGIVEYLTAFLLLMVSVFIFIKVIKNKSSKGSLWVFFNLLMSFGLFFGFGEEISWGQRIFNLSPGDFFMENNLQKETNIHNLALNELKINKWVFSYLFSFVLGAYFFLLLIAYKKFKPINNFIDQLGIPIPQVKHITTFALISLLIFSIPDDKKWELWECLFAVILLSIFIEPYNREEKLLITPK